MLCLNPYHVIRHADSQMCMQVLFITYPSKAPWMRSAFGQTHLLLIVGLAERYFITGLLMLVAMTNTRADGYLWVGTWQTNLLLLIINTVLCLLAAALTNSGGKLRRVDLPLHAESLPTGQRISMSG
jgi:hypothetical protein